MTINAGDMPVYDAKSAKRDRVLLLARATVQGGAGVITQPLTWQDDPAITIVRGASAGLYNLTFPKSADGQGAIGAQAVSAAGTVRSVAVVAVDFAAGTAQIQALSGAGPADPAALDSLIVTLLLSMRKDF